jgi:hypothetical protein
MLVDLDRSAVQTHSHFPALYMLACSPVTLNQKIVGTTSLHTWDMSDLPQTADDLRQLFPSS